MTPADILLTRTEFKNISFSKIQEMPGYHALPIKLEYKAAVLGIREELDAIRIGFHLASDQSGPLTFTIEGYTTVGFKKALDPADFKNKETYAICFRESVSTIIELIASNTGKLGITPLILEPQTLYGLVAAAVKNFDISPLDVTKGRHAMPAKAS